MVTHKRQKGGSLKESEIQRQILEYLASLPYVFAWRNQSTGVYDPMSATWRKLRGLGRIQGVADILGVVGYPELNPQGSMPQHGRFLAIEVKSRYGKPTPEQEAFLLQVTNRGGIGIVARDVEDVVAALADVGGGLWAKAL
jgi:hypothetical protein